MVDQVTTCPACRISFRVTDEQLSMADGRVRCGSCLRVFNALDELRELPVDTGTAGGSRSPPWNTSEDDGEQPDFDEIVSELQEDELWIADLLREVEEVERDRARTSNASEREDTPVPAPSTPAAGGTGAERRDGPQFWFEPDMDADPGDLAIPDYTVRPEPMPDHMFDTVPEHDLEPDFAVQPDIGPEPQPANSAPMSQAEPRSPPDSIAESEPAVTPDEPTFRFGTIDDLEPEPHLGGEPEPAPRPGSWAVMPDDDGPEPAWDLEPELREDATEQDDAAGDHVLDAGTGKRYDFDLDPLELRERRSGSGWHTGTLSLLLAVAVVAVTGWMAWDQRQQWSQVEAYRPVYGWLCSHLDCGLQPVYDLSRIGSSQLVIRHHPDKPGYIAIDMMLTNEAGYAQSYPDFKVEFTDIDGNVLARERFAPADYLGGDLAQGQLMSSGQPVHIRLELKDPGSRAVSYQLELVRPQVASAQATGG